MVITSYKNQYGYYPKKISDSELYDWLTKKPNTNQILTSDRLTYTPAPETKDAPILTYNGVYVKGELLQNETVQVNPKK